MFVPMGCEVDVPVRTVRVCLQGIRIKRRPPMMCL